MALQTAERTYSGLRVDVILMIKYKRGKGCICHSICAVIGLPGHNHPYPYFAVAEITELWGKARGKFGPNHPITQSAMSSENWGLRRVIDNRLTCQNYSKEF